MVQISRLVSVILVDGELCHQPELKFTPEVNITGGVHIIIEYQKSPQVTNYYGMFLAVNPGPYT